MTTVSVVIKALNEEDKIHDAVMSALVAVQPIGGEVILADSLSTDRTVEIARQFDIRIIQLTRAEDRSCGAGAQLGYSIAKGEYIYILDGDMTLQPGFLEAAIAEMALHPKIAGIGGLHEEVCVENLEFKARKARAPASFQPGTVDRLDGGGLYRRSAIEKVGYLTNRFLHSYEELDLAIRLRHAGYELKRIAVPAVKHSGHTENSFSLLMRRWRSGYIFGIGEILRDAWGTPRFGMLLCDLRELRVYLMALIWWAFVAVTFYSAVFSHAVALWVPLFTIVSLPTLMSLRRRHPVAGIYAVTSWTTHLLALIIGFCRSPRDPRQAISSRIVHG